ncbi:MAG TPA: ABC transporter ATP-binding protein [Methylomirabilota bacterium]|nr:ABC transporter ATP-binding protein [Methylomirabilota bacterium]
MSPGAEVRLEGLSKSYGPVVAVRDVSVTIGPGSFFTLLGPSGSGKTTTLMMIAGFVHPTRGEIFVDGRPVAGLPPQKRDLGMVFQSYAVFPHLTVFENIAFPLRVRQVAAAELRRRVGEALELVRLQGYDRRLPRQLSGGEQQRVALARALVFRPRVPLMDEPLGALDKKLRAHMQLELKHLQRQLHVTVVYVTHDQEEALTMSDRVAVMRGGGLEQVGAPAELYEAPANRFVADFLGESNFLDGTVVGPASGSRYRVRTAGGLELQGVGAAPLAAGQAVTAAIRPEKLAPAEAPPAEGNVAKGVVEELIYAGDATRYRVTLGPDGTVSMRIPNRLGTRPYAIGEPVTLGWDPAETRLFPRDVP